MKNALEIIMKERGIRQKELAEELEIKKQQISKWVRRTAKIPQNQIGKLVTKFRVESTYFIDEEGFNKCLSENEERELRKYLLKSIQDNMNNNVLAESFLRDRVRKLDDGIRRTKTMLSKDIKKEQTVFVELDDITSAERRLEFYRKLLKIRKNNKVTDEEWDSIINALVLFTEEKSEIQMIKHDFLSESICGALCYNRKNF